jgi:hypothetical protein
MLCVFTSMIAGPSLEERARKNAGQKISVERFHFGPRFGQFLYARQGLKAVGYVEESRGEAE